MYDLQRMYAWNWISSINNVPTPRESCSVTSEVASCAVKDDTEVEVVTHSLSSLPVSLWHMFLPKVRYCIA